MEWIEKLKNALKTAIHEDDFPDFLTSEIKIIISSPNKFSNKAEMIDELIDQIKRYDVYADSGCFNNLASPEEIKSTLKNILS